MANEHNLILYQRQKAWNAINAARHKLAKSYDDSIHLANYILRDLDATKEAKLSDLAWAMHEGNLCKNDVLGLIKHLEKHLLSYNKLTEECSNGK